MGTTVGTLNNDLCSSVALMCEWWLQFWFYCACGQTSATPSLLWNTVQTIRNKKKQRKTLLSSASTVIDFLNRDPQPHVQTWQIPSSAVNTSEIHLPVTCDVGINTVWVCGSEKIPVITTLWAWKTSSNNVFLYTFTAVLSVFSFAERLCLKTSERSRGRCKKLNHRLLVLTVV